MRNIARLMIGAFGLSGLALMSSPGYAANWSDNSIGYRYSSAYTEPSNPEHITKNILSFTHVSGYDYGQNFLGLDVLQSSGNDPANGLASGESSTGGATEFYLSYQHTLSLGKVTGQNLSWGPIKDLGLTTGFDLETKNTTFAPRKRVLVAGPTVQFGVGAKGFVNASLLWAKEWNHCGLGAPACPRADVSFDPQWVFGLNWQVPFQAGSVPMKFQGYGKYASKKGLNYANVETEPEILVRTSLMADVGSLLLHKKNTLWLGVGYEYWHNKYGNRYDGRGQKMAGIQTTAPTLQAEFHF